MQKIGITQSLEVIADGNGIVFNGLGIGMYMLAMVKNKAKSVSYWFEYKGRKTILRSICAKFNIKKDLLLVNFDCKTDVDDLHSAASLATIFSGAKYSKMKNHAVADTYGTQGGLVSNI